MFYKTLLLTLTAIATVLLTSAQAQAWGAAHVGYTSVGAGGVQHYGHTTAAGPYGAYSGTHYGTTTGAYHTSTGSVNTGGATYYHTGATTGYQAGGFGSASVTHTGTTGVYRGY